MRDGVKVGPTVHSLKSKYLEGLEIPDIGITEQRRIAARLKAQLAKVETARKAAEAQLAEIKVLPQKILARAFEE